MVAPTGVEPASCTFGGCCSSWLSYGVVMGSTEDRGDELQDCPYRWANPPWVLLGVADWRGIQELNLDTRLAPDRSSSVPYCRGEEDPQREFGRGLWVHRVGVEPTTISLSGKSSTIELSVRSNPRRCYCGVAGRDGIEPSSRGFQSRAKPSQLTARVGVTCGGRTRLNGITTRLLSRSDNVTVWEARGPRCSTRAANRHRYPQPPGGVNHPTLPVVAAAWAGDWRRRRGSNPHRRA